MSEQSKCPLCGSTSDVQGLNAMDSQLLINCSVCGRFVITTHAMGEISGWDDSKKSLLSGFVRERSDGGSLAELWQKDLNAVISSTPASLDEKLDRLLSRLVSRTKHFGETLTLRPVDRAIGYAVNRIEFDAQIDYLTEARLVKDMGVLGDGTHRLRVTAAGVARVEEYNRIGGMFSNKAFVAMWFEKSLDPKFENSIRKAILDAGYDEPMRVDREQYNGRIDDQIIVGLKQCKFVVADFTGQRNGVYYEAGFAHGQGKQVIMCCPTAEVQNLHFDTNHVNHIVYENDKELEEKLKARILATIGPGKNYAPVP